MRWHLGKKVPSSGITRPGECRGMRGTKCEWDIDFELQAFPTKKHLSDASMCSLEGSRASREVEELEERQRKKEEGRRIKKRNGKEREGKAREEGREGMQGKTEGMREGKGREGQEGGEGKGRGRGSGRGRGKNIVRAEERPVASRRARPNRQAEIEKHEQPGQATQRLSSFVCAFSQTTVSCLAAMTFSGFDGASYVMVGCGSPGTRLVAV